MKSAAYIRELAATIGTVFMFRQFRSKTQIFVAVGFLSISFLYTSCGPAYKKQVVGKYYIIGVDTETDLYLSYELSSGNYVGKAPPRIIEYGFNDTLIVAKSQEYNKSYPTYYIIDMRKDSELAHEATFRIGPLEEKEFDSIWRPKLNVQMNVVK